MIFDWEPLPAAFGIRVRGVQSLVQREPQALARLDSLWRDHAVIVIRGEPINDDEHVGIAAALGPLEIFPQAENRSSRFPEITRVTNTDEQGRLLDAEEPRVKYFNLARLWHKDSTFRLTPSRGAIVRGIMIPDEGGVTEFVDLRKVYEALPPERRRWLKSLRAVHSFEFSRAAKGLPPMTVEEIARVPPVEHPLLAQHPGGRWSLNISPLYIERIIGMSPDSSRELIEELTVFATDTAFVYRHHWQPNDILMWDNRTTMHRVTPFDTAHDPRILHRTVIAGTLADEYRGEHRAGVA